MTIRITPLQVLATVLVGGLLAGSSYAYAATQDGSDHAASSGRLGHTVSRSTVIHGCVNRKTHALTVTAKCRKGTVTVSWNRQGRAGAKGARGPSGAAGAPGTAATVNVGAVSTGAPGSQASVTNAGTASNATLDITIPQGQPGTTGYGATADGQVWMGSSTAQLAPGSGHNIVGVGSAGVGSAVVDVQGCSSEGLADPVPQVTAVKDPHDTLTGANNTANVADAYVSGWSIEPGTSVLVVDVDTTNPVNGLAVDSDFSISVIC